MSEVRLIDANAPLQAIRYLRGKYTLNKFTSDCLRYVEKKINAAPTIDAAPVVHGRWIVRDPDESETPECSECGRRPLLNGGENYELSEFCPRCGARMDEELAGLLHQAYTDGVCDLIRSMRDVDAHVNTISDYQNWLKRPAKEEP